MKIARSRFEEPVKSVDQIANIAMERRYNQPIVKTPPDRIAVGSRVRFPQNDSVKMIRKLPQNGLKDVRVRM
jgi:hypothetical protein